MSDSPHDRSSATRVERLLDEAIAQLDVLEAKLRSGAIEEREVAVLAYELVGKIEDARAGLEKDFGTVDAAAIEAENRERLTPEAFESWKSGKAGHEAFRTQWERERPFRDQLVEGKDKGQRVPFVNPQKDHHG